jgi:hypothetical protein
MASASGHHRIEARHRRDALRELEESIEARLRGRLVIAGQTSPGRTDAARRPTPGQTAGSERDALWLLAEP